MNDRVALGESLLNWHNGMDHIYAVGSFYVSGKPYPDPEVADSAVAMLERELGECQRMRRGEVVEVVRQGRKVSLRDFAGYSDDDLDERIRELTDLVGDLRYQVQEDAVRA